VGADRGDRSAPLFHRGPEALQHVLAGDREAAHEQLLLLTRTELRELAAAAGWLSEQALGVVTQYWPNTGR
jgi:hypothetical protein